MAIRLRSTLKRIPWFLLVKSSGLILLWIFTPYWVFALAAVYFYVKSGPRVTDLLSVFLLLLGISIFVKLWLSFASIGKILIEFNAEMQYAFAAFLYIGWATLFGIKELVFLHRREVLVFLETLIFLLAALLFFWFITPGDFYPAMLGFIAVPLFLFAEFYNFSSKKNLKNFILYALVSTLVILEVAWAVSLLSVSIFQGIALIALFWFFIQRAYLLHEEGALTKRTILNNLFVFLIFLVLTITFPG